MSYTKITVMKQSAISFLIVRNYNNRRVKISFANSENLEIIKKEVVRRYLLNMVSRPGKTLEIDLSEVKFIDSEGFDILNLLARIAKKYGSRILLSCVGKELSELINLVKKYSVFYIKEINTSAIPVVEPVFCCLN